MHVTHVANNPSAPATTSDIGTPALSEDSWYIHRISGQDKIRMNLVSRNDKKYPGVTVYTDLSHRAH